MSTTIDVTNAAVFERRESDVHSHHRNVDAIFTTSTCSIMRGVGGREYIDFLSGAGSLKDGGNHLHLIAAGRYRRIPAGHDARGIASGDARRGGQNAEQVGGRRGLLGRSTAVPIHAAAFPEYLVRDGINAPLRKFEQKRIALLWRGRPR